MAVIRGVELSEFDIEDSRGKISILAGASESRIFEQRHYADGSCFDSRLPATGVVKTVLLVWYGHDRTVEIGQIAPPMRRLAGLGFRP